MHDLVLRDVITKSHVKGFPMLKNPRSRIISSDMWCVVGQSLKYRCHSPSDSRRGGCSQPQLTFVNNFKLKRLLSWEWRVLVVVKVKWSKLFVQVFQTKDNGDQGVGHKTDTFLLYAYFLCKFNPHFQWFKKKVLNRTGFPVETPWFVPLCMLFCLPRFSCSNLWRNLNWFMHIKEFVVSR